MGEETIVAVFDSESEADAAVRDLQSVVPASAVSRHSSGTSAVATSTTDVAPSAKEPGFWSSLFGGEPDHSTALYDRSVERGGVVVTVKATAEQAVRVTEIIERHNPIDLDERASSYGLTTTAPTAPVTGRGDLDAGVTDRGTAGIGAGAGDRLELSEESLTVGKRAVSRGTTRVRRFVVERPVEEQVTLRDEKVSVQRRPVADGRSVNPDFSDKTIEMTETGEEAVVGKTARVTEEVLLSKAASDRVETVRDTVRKEDVEIQTVPGSATGTTTTTGTGMGAATPTRPTPSRV